MFTIRDGRECFYAWDLDRQIVVEDPSIVEVHFCNRTDECSLVVEVKDEDGLRVANVPNIILQKSFDVRVFGYDGKATRFDEVFKVKARTKPTDYVYTETEVKNYDDLVARVDEIEKSGISEEAITGAVENYLEKNPISFDGYATEEYVDEATEPNKCFYIDIDKCEIDKSYDLTDEMIALIEYFEKYGRAHVFIKYNQTNTVGSSGYVPAKIYRFAGDEYDITTSELDSFALCSGQTQRTIYIAIANGKYKLKYQYGKTEAIIATTDYVDNAIANIEIPESGSDVDLSNYYTKEEVDTVIEAIPEAEEIYRLVKPDSEPTQDPMDGDKVLVTDAHTIEYLNRVFNGDAVLGYTWRIGLNRFLITDFAKSINRLSLRAHRLFVSTIDHYTFYIDKEDDGNWYWVGYKFEEYDIQKATNDAIQTAFDDVVTAEGGAY